MRAKLNWAEALVVFLFSSLFVLCIAGAVWWLWGTVLGYFWPTGPTEVIDPDFWPFFGAMFLFKMLVGGFNGK